MKRLVIGNWKMRPETLDEAKTIVSKTKRVAASLSRTDVVVCPPLAFLSAVAPTKGASTPHFALGAQTVSFEEMGSHTGEVGAAMLSNIGVEYVIVGHSEQRAQGETDAQVARRIIAALEAGMEAVLCVGEVTRDEGGAYLTMLSEQIKNSLAGVVQARAKHVILAYEPVWAVGAAEAMKPELICEMALFVRKIFADIFSQDQAMKAMVLYGGSVNSVNAAEIISVGQVDGLLVGRESVNPTGFADLLKVVDEVN